MKPSHWSIFRLLLRHLRSLISCVFWLDAALSLVSILIGDIMVVIGLYLGKWRHDFVGLWGGPCWLLKVRQIETLGVHMKWVLPWFPLASSCRYNRFLSWLGCCSQPSTILFSSPRTFSLWVDIAQQPGQAVVLGRRSLCWTTSNCLV